MATLARPFRPWEIVFDPYLGLHPPAADYDLGCGIARFQRAMAKSGEQQTEQQTP